MELADRHNLDEWVLRPVTALAPEDQIEMVQQIVQFGLSGKQVEKILSQEEGDTPKTENDLPKYMNDFANSYSRHIDDFDTDSMWAAFLHIHGDEHMTHAFLMRLGEMAFSAARKYKAK